MTKIRITTLILATVASLAAAALASPASARNGNGFLADLGVATGVITPGQADALDGAHAAVGAPLNQFNPLQGGGFQAAPGGGGFQPAYQPAPMMAPALGNFCFTQGGRFGPGPAAPIGYPCQAFGWFGSVS